MHVLKAAPSKLHANAEPTSLAVKLKLAEVLFVEVAGPDVIVVTGGVLSIVTLTAEETVELFEVSTALAVIVARPSGMLAEFQLML